MDIDIKSTSVYHVMQDFGSFKELGRQIVLIKVDNWKMNGFYALLFVPGHHKSLIDASEPQITISLDIKNTIYTSFE